MTHLYLDVTNIVTDNIAHLPEDTSEENSTDDLTISPPSINGCIITQPNSNHSHTIQQLLTQIMDRLDSIDKKIEGIEKRLDMLNLTVTDCKDSCNNMDSHISFVNGVYDRLKQPIDYISGRFSLQ